MISERNRTCKIMFGKNINQNINLLGLQQNLHKISQKLHMTQKILIQKLSSETQDLPPKSSKKSSKDRISTLWIKEENLIYIQFLKQNIDNFSTQEVRRQNKVFIQLAKLMPSRTSDQCRSHHQKMMISHGCIDQIIKHLQKKISKLDKKQKKRVFQIEIETLRQQEMEPEIATPLSEYILSSQIQENLDVSWREDSLWDVLL